MQTVVPMLAYEDAGAAVEWLTRAFGFRENPSARYEVRLTIDDETKEDWFVAFTVRGLTPQGSDPSL